MIVNNKWPNTERRPYEPYHRSIGRSTDFHHGSPTRPVALREGQVTPRIPARIGIKAHTILLVQPGPKPETRTFSDYESVNECMEGVCKIYEEHLKRMNPNTPSITYDISQLFDFIDQLADLSCLVYQKSTNTYAPYNKDWIKEKIYILLRRQAAKAN